ncbi:MAG: UV DNA damage repair endonuclease UvsE [Candidatus Woesearchaeota archaeon]
MKFRVGFPCIHYSGKMTTGHGTILRCLTREKFYQKIDQNISDLSSILKWMKDSSPRHRVFRLSSGFIPFASHKAYQRSWGWENYLYDKTRDLRNFIHDNNFRLSIHPGQFTVLNSKKDEIVQNSIREVDYSSRLLDIFDCGLDSRVILHLGGVYGDKESSINRLVHVFKKLSPSSQARVSFENDEKSYSIDDVLSVSKDTESLPVLDLHHHQLNPSRDILDASIAVSRIWKDRSLIPKIHISSSRPRAKKGAHSNLLDIKDYSGIREIFPDGVDIMVEAKHKELASIQVCNFLNK